MIKYLIILTLGIAFISCRTDYSAQTERIPIQVTEGKINIIQDTIVVKNWLTKVISDFVNSDYSEDVYDKLRASLTKDYYNYKYDAITLEYNEITEKEFNEKWNTKYETKYVGNGNFFTSVMDNGNIEIPVCRFIKSVADTVKIFNTVVHDLRWKTDYVFDIKVISIDNRLLIDDIKEYK
jgi:hypothetical protein